MVWLWGRKGAQVGLLVYLAPKCNGKSPKPPGRQVRVGAHCDSADEPIKKPRQQRGFSMRPRLDIGCAAR